MLKQWIQLVPGSLISERKFGMRHILANTIPAFVYLEQYTYIVNTNFLLLLLSLNVILGSSLLIFMRLFFFKYYSYPLRTELLCYLNSQDWLQIWLWTFNYLIYYQNIKPHQNPLCGTHHRAVHVYRIIPVSPCVHGWSTTQNSINLYPFTRCLYYDHNHKTSILRLDID